jgi:hypothetical protein
MRARALALRRHSGRIRRPLGALPPARATEYVATILGGQNASPKNDRRDCVEMITRRSFVFASMLAVALAPAGMALADPASKAFLEKIYAAYKGKNSKGIPLDSDAMLRLYFEPKLAALMIKDRKDAAKRGDVPELDSDPFVNGQDWEIGPVDIAMRDLAPDKASATVKFRNLKVETTVLYDLVRLKDGWRIADITWDGNDTLRGIFVKK